ncbi:MAG: CRISPR-associated endonuclease Cas2 [Peptococcaceae bacterium]|nr:CRISPR-associated endonuclease Cas2 [Peptococcaceae bacterium]
MKTFVFYDIVEDKIRNKVFNACKDYGLTHIQYSAFFGDLTQNRREELYQRLRKILGSKEGNIVICPVCDKDIRLLKEINIKPAKTEEAAEAPAPYAAYVPKRGEVLVV